MKKRGANNLRIGNSIDQLKIANATQAVEFALNAFVGCGIEPCGIRKHCLATGDIFQNSSGLAVSRRNEPMHSLLAELPHRRCQRPPRHASSILRSSAMPGWLWRSM